LSYSKEDKKRYNKQWLLKNPEYKKEYRKQWAKNNPQYRKIYYEINRERILERQKQWLKNNPEKVKEMIARSNKKWREVAKKWREDNKEYLKKYKKEYRKNNRDGINAYRRLYMKTDIGKAIHQRDKIERKTIFKDIINTLTHIEWLNILEEFNYKCAYCGCEFTGEKQPAKDHIIPISKGGNNTRENIVPSCQSCNSSKGNKLLIGGTYAF